MTRGPHEVAIADVAIVGAGPTGLALAILLAQRGRSVVVLERFPAPYPLPRAVHFDDEMALRAESARLGWHVTPTLALGEPGRVGTLEAVVTDSSGTAISGASVQVLAMHNARASRQLTATLADAGDGRYRTPRPGSGSCAYGHARHRSVCRPVARRRSPRHEVVRCLRCRPGVPPPPAGEHALRGMCGSFVCFYATGPTGAGGRIARRVQRQAPVSCLLGAAGVRQLDRVGGLVGCRGTAVVSGTLMIGWGPTLSGIRLRDSKPRSDATR
jgi:glycine/D-amino acid oxidase-like deaminating enzyme